MAKSGDLEVEAPKGTPRPVAEAEVIASHHRQDRFRQHRLLRPLLTEEPPGPVVEIEGVELDEHHVRQYIMAQLAWRMGLDGARLAKGYRRGHAGTEGDLEERCGPQIKTIVERHARREGLVHATPYDNDLYLLLRK